MKSQLRSDEDTSIAGTLALIGSDLRHIFSQEVKLAETRLTERLAETKTSLLAFFAGLFMAIVGLMAAAIAIERGMNALGASSVFSFAVVAILYIGAGLGLMSYKPRTDSNKGIQNGR